MRELLLSTCAVRFSPGHDPCSYNRLSTFPSQKIVSINPIRLRRILPIKAAMPSSKTGIPIKECSFREFVPNERIRSLQFGNEFSLSSRFPVHFKLFGTDRRMREIENLDWKGFHCSRKRNCKQCGKDYLVRSSNQLMAGITQGLIPLSASMENLD